MTTQECATLVTRIFTGLPVPRELRDPAAAQVIYIQRLERLDYADLDRAVDRILDHEPAVPPIAVIREYVAAVVRERTEREAPRRLAEQERDHQARLNGTGGPDGHGG